jgi:putative nucleotidyltransferase with HDIG domain
MAGGAPTEGRTAAGADCQPSMPTLATNGLYARLESWFADYVAGFDRADPRRRPKYDLKEAHSRRVAAECAAIAAAVGLDAEEAVLARAAGLLHDIGRFPQVARFATFDDRVSVDHGALGAEVIRDHRLLEELEARDRRALENAVRLHNRARLPAIAEERTARLARLVRDADKLDILRVVGERRDAAGALPPGRDLSPEVLADIAAAASVRKEHIRSRIDWVFFRIGWLFDVNFDPALERILDRGHYDMLQSMLPQTENVAAALAAVEAYLERRLPAGRRAAPRGPHPAKEERHATRRPPPGTP